MKAIYTEENLKIIISQVSSIKEALKMMSLRAAGGNYQTIKRYINEYKIDISHFETSTERANKMVDRFVRKPINQYLIENSDCSRNSLKSRLYKEGFLDRKCCLCGQDENWNGMKISLILDHINGVHNDNRIDNLRIVCPNCNAGLETFAGKNTKRIKKEYQCECGKEKSKESIRCVDCQSIQRRTKERPPLEQLIKEVEELGYRAVGRKYGVSDNAIRKWLK